MSLKVQFDMDVWSDCGLCVRDREMIFNAIRFVMKNSCAFEGDSVMMSHGICGRPTHGELVPKKQIEAAIDGFLATSVDFYQARANDLLEDKRDEAIDDGVSPDDKENLPKNAFVVVDVEVKNFDGEEGVYITMTLRDEEYGSPDVLQILPLAEGDQSLLQKPEAKAKKKG